MAAVVLNFVGDDIPVEDKEVLSIKVASTFESEKSRLKAKLQFATLDGTVLYRCEGKKPHVRPTYPISWKSTPGKEKLKLGDFLWAREATRLQQEKDVAFQKSLEEFRRAKGLSGPQPGLADVEEFMEELSSKLAAVETKDISSREAEARRGILADEFRSWQNITIEYREKQLLKAKESKERAKIEAELATCLDDGYVTHIAKPRFARDARALDQEASAAAAALSDEESDAFQRIEKEAGFSFQKASASDERRKAEEAEEARRKAKLERAAMGGDQLSDEQMTALLGMLQAGAVPGGQAAMDLAEALAALEKRLDKSDPKSGVLMRALSSSYTEALDRKIVALQRDEQDVLREHEAKLATLDRQATLLKAQHVANEDEKRATRELLAEQQRLLAELRRCDDDSERLASEAKQKAQHGALAAVAGSMVVAMERINDTVERLETSRQELEESLAATTSRAASAPPTLPNSNLANSGEHPDGATTAEQLTDGEAAINNTGGGDPGSGSGGGWLWEEGPLPSTRAVLADAALRLGLPCECGYGDGPSAAAVFVAEMLKQYVSPWSVADAIECYNGDANDHGRLAAVRRVRRCCDEHAPHLSCTAGLLVDMHRGRDTELCAAIIRGATASSLVNN